MYQNNYIINNKKNTTFSSIDDSFRVSYFEIDYRFDNQECLRNLVYAFYKGNIIKWYILLNTWTQIFFELTDKSDNEWFFYGKESYLYVIWDILLLTPQHKYFSFLRETTFFLRIETDIYTLNTIFFWR